MKKIISMTLALAMVATSGASFAGASEAHSRDGRYERYHHDRSYDRHRDYDRGYYDDRRYRERRRNNDAEIAVAAIVGLALGAALASSSRGSSVSSHARRCEQRYRSYDRRTDTYVGRDGRRYYCRL